MRGRTSCPFRRGRAILGLSLPAPSHPSASRLRFERRIVSSSSSSCRRDKPREPTRPPREGFSCHEGTLRRGMLTEYVTEEQPITDIFSRPLRNLRISVTDRCNLRCQYCMPEGEYVWLPREDLLTFEEVSALVDVFADLGVEKVRLTGGEPLLRRDLPRLVRLLAAKPRIRDLAITTNGVLLAEQARALYEEDP